MKSGTWAYRLADIDDYCVIHFADEAVDEAEAREAVRGAEQLADDEEFDIWPVEVGYGC